MGQGLTREGIDAINTLMKNEYDFSEAASNPYVEKLGEAASCLERVDQIHAQVLEVLGVARCQDGAVAFGDGGYHQVL